MLYLSLPDPGPFGWGVCSKYLRDSLGEITEVQDCPNTPTFGAKDPMLHAIRGADLLPITVSRRSLSRNVGLAFIEDFQTAGQYVNHGKWFFDHIIAGSTWCQEKLWGIGLRSVSVAIQGVDTSLFVPTGNELPHDKYMILSGGKLEYRKGQDIVIAAFKRLMNIYPDMHLLCAWGNIWPTLVDSLKQSKCILYPEVPGSWKEKAEMVMTVNGIPPARYSLIDMMPHEQTPALYRSAHVAVFPSRCEAGTNLPMVEAMACGVPVIGTLCTGHSDVLAPGHSLCIVSGRCGENEWFEADVDAVRSAIEYAYHNREEVRAMGLRGSDFIRCNFTWDKTAKSVLAACQLKKHSTTLPINA